MRRWHRLRLALVVLLTLGMAGSALADAPNKETKKRARELYNKGVAEYNLGHYGDAANAYEEAYRLLPDAAFLYNAAQAHRLAGNRERAVDLYMGYLRTFGDQGGKQAEAERFVTQLRAEIEADKEKARQKAADEELGRKERERREEERKDALARAAAAALVAQGPPKKPWYKRAWVWGVIGGVVVVGVGVGVGVGLGVKNDPVANATVQVLP
jgi:tetratricopeptide (TPR) repeat protein